MSLTISSSVRLSSGSQMPALGFGVFQSSSAKSSVSEALRVGYRHIDSAQYYRNEAQVGQAVRESELSREDVFLTSKVLSYGAGYQGVHSAVVESLKRFKFEYLDLFLLHDPNGGKRHRLASWKALLELKAAGKLRNTGVSNFGVKHLQEIKDAGMELPSVNQIELHPLCQQRPIVEFCLANDIVVQAYSPLLQGNLSHPMFSQIAEKHNKTPAQVVLRWSLQKGFVPLPKSDTPSRIQANRDLYDFVLDDDDMHNLDNLDRGSAGAVTWNPVNAP